MTKCQNLLFLRLLTYSQHHVFFQNKKELLERILRDNENMTLHTNHFLLTGVREKLIQVLMAMRGLTSSEDESLNNLKYQVELFRKVKNVMAQVDLPRDFWDATLAKMERELDKATENTLQNH